MDGSQRALADVEKVAKAIFRADDMVAKPDFAWGGTTAASYRAMAVAAITALGLSEEQYRSAVCADDQDYDMVRLTTGWRSVDIERWTKEDT